MTSQFSIMEKMSTFLNKTIHIMLKYIVHLHDHKKKMMFFMKPSILANLSNDAKFHNYTS